MKPRKTINKLIKEMRQEKLKRLNESINKLKIRIYDLVLEHPYCRMMDDIRKNEWRFDYDDTMEKYVRLRIKYHNLKNNISKSNKRSK